MLISTLPVFSYPVERRAAITLAILSSAIAISLLTLGILAKAKVSGLQHISSINTRLLLSVGLLLALVTGLGIYLGRAQHKAELTAMRARIQHTTTQNYAILKDAWDTMYHYYYPLGGYLAFELESRDLYLTSDHVLKDIIKSTSTFTFSVTKPSDRPHLISPDIPRVTPRSISKELWSLLPYLEENESIQITTFQTMHRTGNSIIININGDVNPLLSTVLITTLQSRSQSAAHPSLFQSILSQNHLYN